MIPPLWPVQAGPRPVLLFFVFIPNVWPRGQACYLNLMPAAGVNGEFGRMTLKSRASGLEGGSPGAAGEERILLPLKVTKPMVNEP